MTTIFTRFPPSLLTSSVNKHGKADLGQVRSKEVKTFLSQVISHRITRNELKTVFPTEQVTLVLSGF